MALSVSTQYDHSNDLARRLAQQRQDTELDPQVVALANQNKKKVLAKRAGASSMRRLQQEYADQGIALGGKIDADGNMEWDYNKNIFDKVKAAGKNLSSAPKNEYAGRAQMGNAQLNQYATQNPEGNLTNIESGDANALLQKQQEVAQSAQRMMNTQSLPSIADRQFSSFLGTPQGQSNAQAPSISNAEPNSQPNQATNTNTNQNPNTSVQQNNLPDRKVRIGEKYSREESKSSSDSFSGGNSPLMTELNYQQSGYEDPGTEQAAMRLRNAMYGTQGDVLRNLGIQQGATAEEQRGQQDLEMLGQRYGAYNQTVMQPKLDGRMQGGAVNQSSSASENQSQRLTQSRDETSSSSAAAQRAAERINISTISGNKIPIDGDGRMPFGTTAKAADLEGTRFFEDVVNGLVRGVSLRQLNNGEKEFVFQKGTDLSQYVGELQGRIANRGATGVTDNTLPAAITRAAGMRDLGAVQGQQRQVGNPDPSSMPNAVKVFDQARQDSLIKAAERIKNRMRKK